MYYTIEQFKRRTTGLYFLFQDDQLVYIGISMNVFHRVGHHISRRLKQFNRIRFIECDPNKMLHYESRLIKYFKPKYNHWQKDQPQSNRKQSIAKELKEAGFTPDEILAVLLN